MTIDEAIVLLKFNNKHIADLKNDDLQQLAEWLEELKDYRDKNKMVVRVDVSRYAENQYNKAIDDFVKFVNTLPTVEEDDGTIRPMWLEEMAEQLKVGGENV